MTSSRLLRTTEFLLWVTAVTAAVVVGCAVLAVVFGDGLLTLKYALFVVGFLMFGAGSVGIQPRGLRGQADGIGEETAGSVPSLGGLSTDSDDEYGFEARLQRLPPLRDEPLPPAERVSRDWKLFAASLTVLGVSLSLEVGLGVSV